MEGLRHFFDKLDYATVRLFLWTLGVLAMIAAIAWAIPHVWDLLHSVWTHLR